MQRFEAAGCPTFVVATEAFIELAIDAATALRLPHSRILTVAHPIGGATEEELEDRAETAADALLASLTQA